MGEDLPFDKALERLEEIVECLEHEEPGLEEALKLFEEGVKLVRLCGARLKEAEGEVEELVELAGGSLGRVPLEPEEISP